MTVPEPLESVNLPVVLDQFGLGNNREEPLPTDRERKLGREGEQAAGDATIPLGFPDVPGVRLKERHLDMVLVPPQPEQAQDCVRGFGIDQFEDLGILDRGASVKLPARLQAPEVVRLDWPDVRYPESACLNLLNHADGIPHS